MATPDTDRETVRPVLAAMLLRFMEDAAALAEAGWIDGGIEPPCRSCPAWLALDGRSHDAWPATPEDVWDVVEVWDAMRSMAVSMGFCRDGIDDAGFLDACSKARAWRWRFSRDCEPAAGSGCAPATSPSELVRWLVARHLEAFPDASWADIWAAVPNHYKDPHTMGATLRMRRLAAAGTGPP